jgi:hypothetical protein
VEDESEDKEGDDSDEDEDDDDDDDDSMWQKLPIITFQTFDDLTSGTPARPTASWLALQPTTTTTDHY